MQVSTPVAVASSSLLLGQQQQQQSEELNLVNLTEDQQREFAVELIRNTPEYKAAWELELWKKREKTIYKKQLEDRGKQHLKNVEAKLREEFTKYEKQITEQKEMLKGKEQQCNQVLEEMEKRERQLLGVEQELRRRKTELESDYQRKIEHMEHVIKMEKESFQQRLQLETIKNQELEKRIDQQLSHDVKELSEKITKLQVENENLESKLHQSTNSKQNYKIQWKKVSEELIRTKKRHEIEQRKLHQKIMALQTLQTSPLTPPTPTTQQQQPPILNPYGFPQSFPHYPMNHSHYPYPPSSMQPFGDPIFSMQQHNNPNAQLIAQQSLKQEDEIGNLKKMLADLIKKEEEDKKDNSKLNTSTTSNSSSTSSGSSSSSSSSSPASPTSKFPNNAQREGSSTRGSNSNTTTKLKQQQQPSSSSTTGGSKKKHPAQQQSKHSGGNSNNYYTSTPQLHDNSFNSNGADESTLNNTHNDISVEAHNFANQSLLDNDDERSREFKRLLREKSRLLKSGIYDSRSDIILEIEKKLQSM